MTQLLTDTWNSFYYTCTICGKRVPNAPFYCHICNFDYPKPQPYMPTPTIPPFVPPKPVQPRQPYKCPVCDGTTRKNSKKCPACKGSGVIWG